MHGLAREHPNRLRVLNSLYRFGIALEGGFHHDVQWSRKKALKNERFVCCDRGEILVSGTHVNIFPNDYVKEPAQR
jgi:hypothetical protein